MNCNQFAKYITDYVDGTLDRGVAGEMEMHMSLCHDCNSFVTELENTSSLIRSLDRLTAPMGFEDRLKARITSTPAHEKTWRQRLAGWLAGSARKPFVLRPVFAALVVCLILIGSTFALVQRAYTPQPDMDWEYLGKIQAEHANFASANPLADDSAIILTERARDLGEEL